MRRIAEGASMIRTKGEPGTGDIVQAVRHMRLMMQLGAEGVFVGSGIFKSGDPVKRASAIVKAVTNFRNPQILAQISEDLGEAMVGINENEIQILMAERGK
ncbi:pyridoxal biosynthesis lyase PdxS [Streptococcus pneumoniae]|nr:pyridoxal biosynthesis lyase PdxS [Streptococcus pneumoniae]